MRDNQQHTPVGVKDFLFSECARKTELEKRLEKVFSQYGYGRVESPMFEYLEVFSEEKKQGLDTKELYQFFDRDGAALVLRPDMTPPIARIAATVYQEEMPPLRISYFGNTFRISGDYQGKMREHPQGGIELLGVNSIEADAEVLALAVKSLLACGFLQFKITIGQVAFFKAALSETGLPEEVKNALMEAIAKRDYVQAELLVKTHPMPEKSKTLFLRLPRLVGTTAVLKEAAALTDREEAREALFALGRLYTLLKHYGVAEYVAFDLGMVGKLDYYTGIIFRGYTYGTGYAVLTGGRYDHLVAQFGRDMPAVGFGIRLSGVLDALAAQEVQIPIRQTDALFAYSKQGMRMALQMAQQYREGGRAIEWSLLGDGLEKNIAYAKGKKIPHLLYFLDEKNVKVVSLADEMGGYTVDTTVSELVNVQEGGQAE